jgi:putative peptidoglycan lipid II flippase
MASLSLTAYAVGLLGHMLVKVLAPGYFSRQDTSTPVKYGLVALVSNMALNLVLVWHFKHAGLALATSLSAFINAGLLFYGLLRSGALELSPGWAPFITRLVFANICMIAVLHWLSPDSLAWFAFGFWERFGIMLLICAAGAVTYASSLALAGFNFKDAVR